MQKNGVKTERALSFSPLSYTRSLQCFAIENSYPSPSRPQSNNAGAAAIHLRPLQTGRVSPAAAVRMLLRGRIVYLNPRTQALSHAAATVRPGKDLLTCRFQRHGQYFVHIPHEHQLE